MASSEAIPFAKTGGLADVAGTLPIELAKRGHHCSAFLPAYRVSKHFLREQAGSQFDESVASRVVDLAGYPVHAWIHRVRLQNSPVDFYLVDQPMYYDRQGLYGDSRGDFGDNCARYCFFSRAVVEAIERLQLPRTTIWQCRRFRRRTSIGILLRRSSNSIVMRSRRRIGMPSA